MTSKRAFFVFPPLANQFVASLSGQRWRKMMPVLMSHRYRRQMFALVQVALLLLFLACWICHWRLGTASRWDEGIWIILIITWMPMTDPATVNKDNKLLVSTAGANLVFGVFVLITSNYQHNNRRTGTENCLLEPVLSLQGDNSSGVIRYETYRSDVLILVLQVSPSTDDRCYHQTYVARPANGCCEI